MSRRLVPVHMVMCDVCQAIIEMRDPNWCEVHDRMPIDMGWRVGESSTNYSWYSTYERAITDRRCK